MIGRVAVYILAGGRSSRFGYDKARAETPGGPLLCHVAAQLQPVTQHVTVVADREGKYADLGLPTIADEYPDRGPLCGILTALRHHAMTKGLGWILVTSCDLVGVQSRWAKMLLDHAEETVDAVAFRGAQWEPLFALYRTRLLPRALALMEDSPNVGPARLLDLHNSCALPLPDNRVSLPQANTLAEMQILMREAGCA